MRYIENAQFNMDSEITFSTFTCGLKPSPGCSECRRLERDVQAAVEKISAIVSRKFADFHEKLRQLHDWQGKRNAAMKVLDTHKRSHYQEDAA